MSAQNPHEDVSTPNAGRAKAPVVICRCEEVTEDEIIAAYQEGYHTVDDIKRKLRCGMGPCQGRTCSQLILALLSRLSGKSQAELVPATTRPPLKPTALEAFKVLDALREETVEAATGGAGQGGESR